jgi:hypothetical protein
VTYTYFNTSIMKDACDVGLYIYNIVYLGLYIFLGLHTHLFVHRLMYVHTCCVEVRGDRRYADERQRQRFALPLQSYKLQSLTHPPPPACCRNDRWACTGTAEAACEGEFVENIGFA